MTVGRDSPFFLGLSNYRLDNQTDLSHLRREELPPRQRCLISHSRGGRHKREAAFVIALLIRHEVMKLNMPKRFLFLACGDCAEQVGSGYKGRRK